TPPPMKAGAPLAEIGGGRVIRRAVPSDHDSGSARKPQPDLLASALLLETQAKCVGNAVEDIAQ
ncbi:MAG TPA: hypothetical protein VEZ12_03250, partial [Herpetosiphonaceae bacterium]|nr:hypothetical protein [Herpetosiphonaceae bacterium]